MDPLPAPVPAAQTPAANVTATERLMADLGERLVVERLHRVLDEGGIQAHLTFCDTMLPYLRGLIALLPGIVHEGAHASALETVRALNATVQERGASPREAIGEGVDLYQRLWQKVMAEVAPTDRPLMMALAQFSRMLLDVSQDGPAVVPMPLAIATMDHIDSQTGLANRQFLEERFGEEILRAQRLQRLLTLVLLDVDRAASAPGEDGKALDERVIQPMAASLLAQTRGFDLAAHIEDDRFALLLPETNRAGAAAILSRLARGAGDAASAATPLQFRAGIAVYPNDGTTVAHLLHHADKVLRQGTPAS